MNSLTRFVFSVDTRRDAVGEKPLLEMLARHPCLLSNDDDDDEDDG